MNVRHAWAVCNHPARVACLALFVSACAGRQTPESTTPQPETSTAAP